MVEEVKNIKLMEGVEGNDKKTDEGVMNEI